MSDDRDHEKEAKAYFEALDYGYDSTPSPAYTAPEHTKLPPARLRGSLWKRLQARIARLLAGPIERATP